MLASPAILDLLSFSLLEHHPFGANVLRTAHLILAPEQLTNQDYNPLCRVTVLDTVLGSTAYCLGCVGHMVALWNSVLLENIVSKHYVTKDKKEEHLRRKWMCNTCQ